MYQTEFINFLLNYTCYKVSLSDEMEDIVDDSTGWWLMVMG